MTDLCEGNLVELNPDGNVKYGGGGRVGRVVEINRGYVRVLWEGFKHARIIDEMCLQRVER